MMKRRQFIFLSSNFALATLISGCKSPNNLCVALLQSALPLQLINSLRQNSDQLGIIQLNQQANLQQLYDLLTARQEQSSFLDQHFPFLPQRRNNSASVNYDLVSIANYSLSTAVQKNLIEPLEIEHFSHWSQISPSFQKLVAGNMQKLIWGAPYRWGCTMIAYRQDKFKALDWQPHDWQDLWQPELKRLLSLPNQPREVIGLILKKLGYSYNTEKVSEISSLASELQALHQQVKFYDSTNYLQPLILGDTWLAVGWSTDILPVVQRYHNIKAIVPESGTSLWADVWVKPKQKAEDSSSSVYPFIDFCWQEQSVKQINLFSKAMSTVDVANNLAKQDNPMSLEIFAKSDFIQQLPSDISEQYLKLWKQLFSV